MSEREMQRRTKYLALMGGGITYLLLTMGWHALVPEPADPCGRKLQDGDVIENRRLGERVTFTRLPSSMSDTASIDVTLASNASVPIAHVHPQVSETFFVHQGVLEVRVDENVLRLTAGQETTVHPFSAHAFRNPTDQVVKFSVKLSPAGQMPYALQELHSYLSKMPSDGVGHFLQMIRFAEAFDVYRAGIPLWIQKLGIACLAPTARLLGYRPFVTKKSQSEGNSDQ